MTPDAVDALARAGLSRRDFLKTSGALVVSFSAAAVMEQAAVAQGPFGTRASHVDPKQLDSWIAIAADGTVTAYTGKCELGQGMLTAQTQLVAEELSVPMDRVTLIQCDTAVCPDQGTTSGSQSTPTNFNERNLAQAGATARETLLRLASARLGVPPDQLTIAAGVITAKGDPSRRITYGELVAGKKLNVEVDARATRKPATEWTVLGAPVPRVDMAAMATGQFEFVHNVRVPGMLHGAVVRPPAVGATLVSVDESSVSAMPGVVKVVVKKNFVGVVAEKPWQAVQAASRLKATWTDGAGLPPQREFYDYLRKQPSRDAFVVNSKDVDETLAKAAAIVKGDLPASVSDARLDGHVVRRRRRAGRQGDRLVADAVRVPDAQRSGDAARRAGRRRPRHLHERRGLLRDQRRRHGVVRRGAAVAGGREAGARPALAQGRDGVGELRLRVRDRSARRHRRRRHHHRVGLRGVVRVARRPARLRHAGQRRHRHAGRVRDRAVQAGAGRRARRRVSQRQQRRAVVCGGPRRRQGRRRRE